MKTKKIIAGLGIALLGANFAHAQNGLNGIIVEKYYRSTAADTVGQGTTGVLPVGSVTYRVYADMATGYTFEALYGNSTHTLSISTSTSFFNNQDRADASGAAPTGSAYLKNNTNALDSWLSGGAAASGYSGVLKSEDNGANNLLFPHSPVGMLTNTVAAIGIPLATQDGMIAGSPSSLSLVGDAASQASTVFGNVSQASHLFVVTNGAISVLGGTKGADTTLAGHNRVLIGQFTTDGVFQFALNLQIGTPSGGSQKFVSSNPQSGEILLPGLTGVFNQDPTVSITSPASGANLFLGNPVSIAATAADVTDSASVVNENGIASVAFYLDGTLKGTVTTAPYTFTVTPTTAGSHALVAKATDKDGNVTTSATVTINETATVAPSVSITSPVTSAVIAGGVGSAPTTIAIAATATDNNNNGSIDSVQFFAGAVKVGSDATSPYSINWTSVSQYGYFALTAKAFNHEGGTATSSVVGITITNPNAKPYFVSNVDTTCVISGFALPVMAKNAVSNVIGFDMVLHYNKAKVIPTGVVTAGSDLTMSKYVAISSSTNSTAGTINISVSLNNTAPNNTFFTGTGELFTVGFNKTSGFASIDTALFTIDSIVESRYTGVTSILVDPGKYITHKDSTFHGSLVFWADNSPIAGGTGTLPTTIGATTSTLVVNPDAEGNFSYIVNQSALANLDFNITRAITNTVSVQPVVNGYDALLAKKVVMQDPTFVPTIFQMLAMDVNQDGVISSGDVTQINQRSVLLIPEYKQAWNYSAAGVSNGQPSKDWVFVDGNTLNTNGTYLISSVYPAADGAGYTRDNVPVPATNIAAPITNAGSCPVISDQTYTGVMLGDVNGNYKDIPVDGMLRSVDTSRIVFDLSKAVIANGYATIPVSVVTGKPVNALDFAVQFTNGISYQSITNILSTIDGLGNFNKGDTTLRFTSNSIQNYDLTQPVASVVVATNNGQIKTSDLTSTAGYINGNPTNVEVKGALTNNTASSFPNAVNIYPNPAGETINVLVIADATVEIYNVNGSLVYSTTVKANQNQAINTQNLANGFYTVKVYNDTLVSVEKVVVAK